MTKTPNQEHDYIVTVKHKTESIYTKYQDREREFLVDGNVLDDMLESYKSMGYDIISVKVANI